MASAPAALRNEVALIPARDSASLMLSNPPPARARSMGVEKLSELAESLICSLVLFILFARVGEP